MTPEVRTACEVIFQEHKIHPIKWNRDSFRGKISMGISEMAREILVKKNIIILPNKSKKVLTHLNPDVADADSFEEAEKIIGTKKTEPANSTDNNTKTYIPEPIVKPPTKPTPPPSENGFPLHASEAKATQKKWWLSPIYLYVVWPLCGVAGGVLLSFLLNFIYTALFLHKK